MRLRRLGYWRSPIEQYLPDPATLIDSTRAADVLEELVDYLRRGHVARAWMGRATCRLCEIPLGVLDLTDGTFCWPEGLDHYVEVHRLRLPTTFIEHVQTRAVVLEEAEMDNKWWMLNATLRERS